ncbi:Os08g0178600 [Oryza sativa Japonica Group]|uniref:Uncharacterized protein n=2 Tax=Oryza sativa subsp. japonica TaxID=39947 RepID=A0A8J8Y9Y8_ORYSJ|nr:hypothetical protein OsJ_26251 [Oryza sativa Japonica Group]KAB8107593.1 hypothetical protein EE612_042459 [Oryza sativa]BAT04091.1 Os08g0178600 [Oryza sativa Japonica Group]
MSLAYVSRLCARAVQAAVRAEQPATTRRRPPHAGRPPPPSSGGGSPAEVAPAAKSVAEEKARRLRRRAEKDEKEFGPQKEMNMNARSDSSSLFLLLLRSSSSSSAAFAALIACLDDSEPPAAAAALSFAFHVVAAPPSRVFPAGAGAGDGATRAPPTRPANLTLIAAAAKLFAFLGEVKGEEGAAVAVLVGGAVRWAAPLVTPAKRRAKAQTCPRFSPHAAS